MPVDDMEKLVSLCRRRGFIFQSSEIYGGINGFWDYGPLGVELKKNIKEAWWQDMVRNPPLGPDGHEISMVGVDCAIIMNPKVWEASGHATGFQDPMVACTTEGCRKLFRADKVSFVTVWPRGSVTNRSDVESKGAAPKIAAGSRSATVAVQFEFGGVADQATEAIRAFGQKNNEAWLKRIIFHGFETRIPPPAVYFRGRSNVDGPKKLGPHEGEDYEVECLVEPLQIAVFNEGRRPCPVCHTPDSLTPPRAFNLMFESHAGAIQSEENKVFLRPETAQGIFVNFKNVLDSTRLKLPFGIAQVGKAFRNEINPRNYTFRSREFEQMEIEFFCKPEESMKWYEFWRDVRKNWYTRLGIKSGQLRPREQGKDELAHYSVGTTDIEYLFPFSDEPQELEGVAHRADYDLKQHMEKSGKDLRYFDEEGWNALLTEQLKPYEADRAKREEEKKKLEKSDRPKFNYLPHVIEPSAGADRFTLAVLCEAYTEDKLPNDKGQLEERLVMKFHPRLAPIKAAIFPLVKKDGMPEMAEKLYHELKQDYNVVYDDGGAIGRRYRRQDEVGTPFCITIDGETLQNQTVTIRERDSAQQRRVPIGDVANEIKKALRS